MKTVFNKNTKLLNLYTVMEQIENPDQIYLLKNFLLMNYIRNVIFSILSWIIELVMLQNSARQKMYLDADGNNFIKIWFDTIETIITTVPSQNNRYKLEMHREILNFYRYNSVSFEVQLKNTAKCCTI